MPHFQNPWFLFLLLILPLLAYRELRRQQKHKAGIRFPSLNVVKKVPNTWALKIRRLLFLLKLLTLALLIIALARPQKGDTMQKVSTNGVDIVLTLDISTSMKTMDFKPHNRLYVAKQTIEKFVLGRKNDRIGLVVFAGKSFTQCPMTMDYSILVQFLRQIDFGMVEDGTAIGTALMTSANRLRKSDAKSRVIIMLTDGENTAGEIDPLTAAKAVQAVGIKVYTIGVGKNGDQPIEIDDPFFGKRIVTVPTRVDEKTLKSIASLTGGKFYRAQNPKALEDVYAEIDKLEKTEIETQTFTRFHERFTSLVLLALAVLFLEIALSNTRFMKIP